MEQTFVYLQDGGWPRLIYMIKQRIYLKSTSIKSAKILKTTFHNCNSMFSNFIHVETSIKWIKRKKERKKKVSLTLDTKMFRCNDHILQSQTGVWLWAIRACSNMSSQDPPKRSHSRFKDFKISCRCNRELIIFLPLWMMLLHLDYDDSRCFALWEIS